MRFIILPYFLLCCTINLSAQYEAGLKFGDVSEADLRLMAAPGDSTAEAYVLYDKLDLRFDYLPDKGPAVEETFHRRLKLLKPSSFERANIELTYDSDFQDVRGLDASVYLPSGEEIKLKRRDFIREQGDGSQRTIKFTFPRIMPGAIIEYVYTRTTESILVPTAYSFQERLPVRWAEYTAMIPKYYRYVSLGTQGEFYINEVKQEYRRWNPSGQRGASGSTPIAFTDMRYVMKDQPAFSVQPYTNNLRDYLPQVRLQLQSVQYPNTISQPVFNNWHTTVAELHERKDFGRYYRVKSNYNQLWKAAEPIIMAGNSTRERIDLAYYFITSRLEWNERYAILGSDTPDRIFDAAEGNSADLNLSLLALLNEAGIPAHPLLVSLRDRGAPMEVYPLINQFNHLMVYTEVEGQPYLLDANGPGRPPGLPRIEALNHRGWVADRDNPHWINVEVPRARRVVLATMQLDETGRAEVSLTGRLESYYAFAGRNQLGEMKQASEAPLVREIVERYPETEVLTHELLDGGDTATQPLNYQASLRLPAGPASDDYLYVQPIILPVLNEELDDVEQRLYPIDFPFPWREQYVATISVPTGFAVDELPESTRLVSEDRGLSATFTASTTPGNGVQVNFTVDHDRTFYRASDYAALRVMYQRIIELQESTIVFKRSK